VKRLAKAKISDINEKIQTLEAMKRILHGLTEMCPGRGPSSECPIPESIDSEKALS
jgi:hypothetical protein